MSTACPSELDSIVLVTQSNKMFSRTFWNKFVFVTNRLQSSIAVVNCDSTNINTSITNKKTNMTALVFH